ncbi:hypothetical protein Tco_0483533 [Tanacetum coccineum]
MPNKPTRRPKVLITSTLGLIKKLGTYGTSVSHVVCFISYHLHICYTDSEPGRVFYGADDEEISEGGVPRVIVYGYDGLPIQPVPQDEDEREPRFIQAHDPNIVPEPVYPEYMPLEDEHAFPSEDGSADYPMDEGDDDDGDTSGDDTNDEDELDEDEDEEEHLALADSDIVAPTERACFPHLEEN